MKNKWYKINNGIVWSLLLSFIAYLTFYILYNASWGIGDDAYFMAHTGNGIPFLPSETIRPEQGRFFPFACLPYNILLLFTSGYISAFAHYIINALFFVVMMCAMVLLFKKITKEHSPSVLLAWILLFFIVSITQRTYAVFQNVFSTIWVDYTLMVLFLFCSYLFYRNGKWLYGVIALLLINYVMYCLENMFLFPLSFAFSALLFSYKTMTKAQKIFHFLILVSVTFFLLLYYVLVYRHAVILYDGSHGSSVGIVQNAISMFISQKMLWLAFLMLAIRMYSVVFKKSSYNSFYDSLLLSAAMFTLGGFILQLNWTLYYAIAVIIAAPSVLYYMIAYFKNKWTFVVLLLFALFHVVKYPSLIHLSQQTRKEVPIKMQQMVDYRNMGYKLIWYEIALTDKDTLTDVSLRDWKENSFRVYMAYLLKDRSFEFDKEFNTKNIILYPSENDLLDKTQSAVDFKGAVLLDDFSNVKVFRKISD